MKLIKTGFDAIVNFSSEENFARAAFASLTLSTYFCTLVVKLLLTLPQQNDTPQIRNPNSLLFCGLGLRICDQCCLIGHRAWTISGRGWNFLRVEVQTDPLCTTSPHLCGTIPL